MSERMSYRWLLTTVDIVFGLALLSAAACGVIGLSHLDSDGPVGPFLLGCGLATVLYALILRGVVRLIVSISDEIGALVKNAGEQNRTLALLLEADGTARPQACGQ